MAAMRPGARLGAYELLSVLAQGGMGAVWLARTARMPGLLALKTILPTHGANQRFRAMFLDEARIASSIVHENVVRVLEWGGEGGFLFLVMEYVEGESLRKLFRDLSESGPFPLGLALRICAQACAGLHAAHELKDEAGRPLDVVHRDVSPQNLIVTLDGGVKLIDFGVAKARDRLTSETTAGTLKGKVEYMAPEQVRSTGVDRRADVYAVGAVLYELISGRPIYETEEGGQLAALHSLISGAPYQPLPEHLPPQVRAIVERAISREPADRFATAEEMRQALEQAIAATGLDASRRQIGELVARVGGARIQKRRRAAEDAMRALDAGRTPAAPSSASTLGDESGPLPPANASHTGTTHAAVAVQPSPRSSVSRAVAAVALLGFAAAAGGLVVWLAGHRATSASAAVAPPSSSPAASASSAAPRASEAASSPATEGSVTAAIAPSAPASASATSRGKAPPGAQTHKAAPPPTPKATTTAKDTRPPKGDDYGF
jgi:serine/threonine-protein kinase